MIFIKKIILKTQDNYRLSLAIFEAENPRGYIQVIHGMEEHKERYEELARYLCKAGYTVITSDMRGHGKTAETLGFFAPTNGYQYLLRDQRLITHYICKHYKTDKVIILAHSMGTIIARNLMQTQSSKYEKVILSGYPNPQPKVTLLFARLLTGIYGQLHGGKYYPKPIEKMSVGSFNHAIKNPKTPLDWLSYNEENVQNYFADPYCGHGFTVSAFRDLFILTENMAKVNRYKKDNTTLPILLIAGEDDAATGFAKGKDASMRILEKAGYENITAVDYFHMRHEIFNEAAHECVFADVLAFLEEEE